MAFDRTKAFFKTLAPAGVFRDSAAANDLAAAPAAALGPSALHNVISGMGTSADQSWWDQWFNRRPLGEYQRAALGRDPLVRRILSLPGEDATREGWRVLVDGDYTQTPEEIAQAVRDYEERSGVNLTGSLRDGYRRARQYGGALVLLGIDDGQIPEKPVDPTKIQRIWWTAVLDRRDFDYGPVIGPKGETTEFGVASDTEKFNAQAALFGQVAYYDITDINGVLPDGVRGDYGCSGTSAGLLNTQTIRVHADRVLYIPGPDALPALDQMQDALAAFFRSQAGLSRAVDRASIMVWKIANHVAKSWHESRDIGRSRIASAMKSMSAQNAVVIDQADEDFSMLGSGSTAGLASVIGDHMVWISALSGIPLTRLFGVSPGGWGTGAGERKDYQDKIRDIQTSDLQPHIRKFALYALSAKDGGVVTLTPPRSIKVEFEDLDPPSETERVERLGKLAEAAVKISGIDGLYLVQELRSIFDGEIELDKDARAAIAEQQRVQRSAQIVSQLADQSKISTGALDAVLKLASTADIPIAAEGARVLAVASGLRPDLALQLFPAPPAPAPGTLSPTPGGETPETADGQGGDPVADAPLAPPPPPPPATPARMLPGDVYSAKELASEFEVPTRTITRLAQKGNITTYWKLGGRAVYSHAEVVEAERVDNLSPEDHAAEVEAALEAQAEADKAALEDAAQEPDA